MTTLPITLDVPISPTWTIMQVRSNTEAMNRAKLADFGVYSFFPGRKVKRHRFGKSWDVERAEVTGYLFALFKHVPIGDNMRERLRGFHGFVTRGGVIVTLPPDVVKRLHGLSLDAQAAEAARREADKLRPGDMARFLTGVLAGHTVEVQNIGKVVTVLLDGRPIKADAASLERVTG